MSQASTTVPAKIVTVKVEKANRGGIMSGGTWYNYGRVFDGEKLPTGTAGPVLELSLVQSSRNDKWYIRSLKTVECEKAQPEKPTPQEEEAPAPPNPRRSEDSASPEALKYLEDLAREAEISSDTLEQITLLRFGTAFGQLTKAQASMSIIYFGGYVRNGSRRSRNGS